MSAPAKSSRIGEPVRRKEDLRLISGKGRFSDDVNFPGQAYAVMLRSPHAHARIRSMDTRKALSVPGVIQVLTGADLLADGIKPMPHVAQSSHPAEPALDNPPGFKAFDTPQHPLAIDRVRFVGEAVAVVVADTVNNAKDGAEQIEIDYEILPSVTATLAAARPGAPRLWDDSA